MDNCELTSKDFREIADSYHFPEMEDSDYFRKIANNMNFRLANEIVYDIIKKCYEGIRKEAEGGFYFYEMTESEYPELLSDTRYRSKLQDLFKDRMTLKGFKVEFRNSLSGSESASCSISWL